MRTLRPALILLLVALAVAGCLERPGDALDTPTAPAAILQTRDGNTGFMPMTPGNHWTYDRAFTVVIIPDDGAPEPWPTQRNTIDVEHVEFREIGEYQYILEREVYDGEGGNERLRRQDRAGYYLFERPKNEGKTAGRPVLSSAMRNQAERIAARYGADATSVETHFARVEALRNMLRGLDLPPDASPPGGPVSGEIQSLEYPLHVGATWVMRDTPLFVATVEAHEQFLGFPAWRVRIEIGLLTDYFVHIWYSRCGEVGNRFYAEGIMTDENGTPLGRIITDDVVSISALNIDRGGCDVASDGGDGGGKGGTSYPITIGNRWTYELTARLKSGDNAPTTTVTIIDDVQEEWVQLKGREYMRQVARPRDTTMRPSAQLFRQDRDGLYQDLNFVPASSRRAITPLLLRLTPMISSGPTDDELTILAYPLKVGASWTIVDFGAGEIRATVVARERLTLPAGTFDAFRIRIDNAVQNPGDEAFVWYSSDGMVKSYVRASIGGDDWVEETWELQELDLVD